MRSDPGPASSWEALAYGFARGGACPRGSAGLRQRCRRRRHTPPTCRLPQACRRRPVPSSALVPAVPAAELPALDCSGIPNGTFPDPSFLGPLHKVTVGNHRLAYRRFRVGGAPTDATPLVLMPRYGSTMSVWGPALLHRLAQRREVIIFDNPGQGLSEELEPGTGPLPTEVMIEAALGLFEALDLTRPHVAGRSMEACAALRMAASYPDRVGKVVSWGGTSLDGTAVLGSWKHRNTLFNPHNKLEDYVPLNFHLSKNEGMQAACRFVAGYHQTPPDEAKPETNMRQAAGLKQAVRPWDWSAWRELGRCKAPVLLMGGTDDILIPAKSQLNLVKQIPELCDPPPPTPRQHIGRRLCSNTPAHPSRLLLLYAVVQAGGLDGSAACLAAIFKPAKTTRWLEAVADVMLNAAARVEPPGLPVFLFATHSKTCRLLLHCVNRAAFGGVQAVVATDARLQQRLVQLAMHSLGEAVAAVVTLQAVAQGRRADAMSELRSVEADWHFLVSSVRLACAQCLAPAVQRHTQREQAYMHRLAAQLVSQLPLDCPQGMHPELHVDAWSAAVNILGAVLANAPAGSPGQAQQQRTREQQRQEQQAAIDASGWLAAQLFPRLAAALKSLTRSMPIMWQRFPQFCWCWSQLLLPVVALKAASSPRQAALLIATADACLRLLPLLSKQMSPTLGQPETAAAATAAAAVQPAAGQRREEAAAAPPPPPSEVVSFVKDVSATCLPCLELVTDYLEAGCSGTQGAGAAPPLAPLDLPEQRQASTAASAAVAGWDQQRDQQRQQQQPAAAAEHSNSDSNSEEVDEAQADAELAAAAAAPAALQLHATIGRLVYWAAGLTPAQQLLVFGQWGGLLDCCYAGVHLVHTLQGKALQHETDCAARAKATRQVQGAYMAHWAAMQQLTSKLGTIQQRVQRQGAEGGATVRQWAGPLVCMAAQGPAALLTSGLLDELLLTTRTAFDLGSIPAAHKLAVAEGLSFAIGQSPRLCAAVLTTGTLMTELLATPGRLGPSVLAHSRMQVLVVMGRQMMAFSRFLEAAQGVAAALTSTAAPAAASSSSSSGDGGSSGHLAGSAAAVGAADGSRHW